MDVEIFENEKDKAQARASLEGFTDLPAWKLLIRAIDRNIQFYSEELRTRKDFNSLVEVYSLQNRVADLEGFKSMPQTLFQEAEPTKEDDPDPY